MAIRFPAAAMVVGYVSRGRERGLFAVIIVLVVTVPSPPTPPLTTQIPTRVRWMAGQVDLTAQVSPIAKEEISRTVSRIVIELLLLRGI